MRIEQIAIYVEGPYYKIEENGEISYAYGVESAKKFVKEAKIIVELVRGAGANCPDDLIEAVNAQNRLMEVKSQK